MSRTTAHCPRSSFSPHGRGPVLLGPGMYTTFEFVEDKAGEWLVHCHVPNHMEGGMMARYIVEQ